MMSDEIKTAAICIRKKNAAIRAAYAAIFSRKDAGERISVITNVTAKNIAIMKKCWQHKPEDRYTFREITPLLEKIQNDLN